MKTKRFRRKFFPVAAALCLLAALLLRPKLVSSAAFDALRLCATALLPSLFPFFVCTNLLIALNLSALSARVLGFVMPRLFRAPPRGAAVFALGLVGGYPMGAQTAAQLYAQGALSREEAERLVCFCNNAGPAFILGVVGTGVFHSAACGAALYLIHALAAILCGVLLRPAKFTPSSARPPQKTQTHEPFAVIFTRSVRAALDSALGLCAFVVVFGVLSRLLLALLPESLPDWLRAAAVGMLELGNGAALLSQGEMPFALRFSLAAFLLGFGGISVWAQTVSILAPLGLRAEGYLSARLLHGAISAVLASVSTHVFPLSASAAAAMAPMNRGGFFVAPALFYIAVTIFSLFRYLISGNSAAKGV